MNFNQSDLVKKVIDVTKKLDNYYKDRFLSTSIIKNENF